MKKYVLSILILMMSFLSFSQTLQPKVIQINDSVHFCFSEPQSKYIATELATKANSDSISKLRAEQIVLLNSIIQNRESSIQQLQLINENHQKIISNYDDGLQVLSDSLVAQEQAIIKHKRQKRFIVFGSVALTSFLILN